MKKLTLSLVAAGLATSSLGAYAALPTGAAPFQIVVPNIKSGLEMTLEGLYVQPTNSDLAHATVTTSNDSGTAQSISKSSLKPKFDFGFRAGFGYVFPNSGNDVQINWTHFSHSADDSVVTPVLSSPSNKTQSASVDFKYNALDLDVGQYISIGTRLQTRVFFGVRGAELRKEASVSNTDSTTGAPVNVGKLSTGSYDAKFVGMGPRVGIDSRYNVIDSFGLVGHFATALLVGNVDVNGSGNSVVKDATFATTLAADTQTRIVPAFDAKLGVDYTIPLNHKEASGSTLTVEAGYQLTQYVGVFDSLTTDGASTTSSAGFHGPYLSLNFKI